MTPLDNLHPLIADYVTYHAEQAPNHETVVFGDPRLTYNEFGRVLPFSLRHWPVPTSLERSLKFMAVIHCSNDYLPAWKYII